MIPGHLDAGYRKGRLWVFGEYSLMSLTLPEDELIARGATAIGNGRGLMHRLGGNARWSFAAATPCSAPRRAPARATCRRGRPASIGASCST